MQRRGCEPSLQWSPPCLVSWYRAPPILILLLVRLANTGTCPRDHAQHPFRQLLGAQAGGEPDDSKLYVAHLPPTMDDDNLRRLFSTYGVVRALGATFFLHFGPRSWHTWL